MYVPDHRHRGEPILEIRKTGSLFWNRRLCRTQLDPHGRVQYTPCATRSTSHLCNLSRSPHNISSPMGEKRLDPVQLEARNTESPRATSRGTRDPSLWLI